MDIDSELSGALEGDSLGEVDTHKVAALALVGIYYTLRAIGKEQYEMNEWIIDEVKPWFDSLHSR